MPVAESVPHVTIGRGTSLRRLTPVAARVRAGHGVPVSLQFSVVVHAPAGQRRPALVVNSEERRAPDARHEVIERELLFAVVGTATATAVLLLDFGVGRRGGR